MMFVLGLGYTHSLNISPFFLNKLNLNLTFCLKVHVQRPLPVAN